MANQTALRSAKRSSARTDTDPGRRMDRVECVVVGAGVVGLAIARRLAQAGREVIVLEAAEGIGTATSSRNSEVIHAGIYYPAGSLMAQMCVSGRHALYDYCRDHGIPHRNCGKLIVATDAERSRQAAIDQAHAEANGVERHANRSSGADARALEPALNCDGRAAVALDRHRRQPRLHAGAARRRRSAPARRSRFHTPLLRAKAHAGRVRDRDRRRCADDARLRSAGQCRRPRRHGGRAQHRRHAASTAFRQPISPRAIISVAARARRSRT